MKKIIALALPLVVLASVVITFTVLEARRVPDWKVKLSEYMAQSRLPTESIKVQTIVKASRPWNFNKSMATAVRNDWRWMVGEVPYPPSEVQCVLLERSQRSNGTGKTQVKHQVVFVNYHTDKLWRVGWLVLEGAQEPFTQEIIADLNTIGCDLSLE